MTNIYKHSVAILAQGNGLSRAPPRLWGPGNPLPWGFLSLSRFSSALGAVAGIRLPPQPLYSPLDFPSFVDGEASLEPLEGSPLLDTGWREPMDAFLFVEEAAPGMHLRCQSGLPAHTRPQDLARGC